jgi:hypothetical protein
MHVCRMRHKERSSAMSRARVIGADGKVREVKNLGWLLSNWARVERFTVTAYTQGHLPMTEAYLVAHLRDGGTYETPYASACVLKHFLDRPVFRGVDISWFGEKFKVGRIPHECSSCAKGRGNC